MNLQSTIQRYTKINYTKINYYYLLKEMSYLDTIAVKIVRVHSI